MNKQQNIGKPYFRQGQVIKPNVNQFKFICLYCHNLKSPTIYGNPTENNKQNEQKKEQQISIEQVELCKFNKCSGEDLTCYVHKMCLENVIQSANEYIDNDEILTTQCCHVQLQYYTDIKIINLDLSKDQIQKDLKNLKNMSYYHTRDQLCTTHNEKLELVKIIEKDSKNCEPICYKCFDDLPGNEKQQVRSLEGLMTELLDEIFGYDKKVQKMISDTDSYINTTQQIQTTNEERNKQCKEELEKHHEQFLKSVKTFQDELHQENTKQIDNVTQKIDQQIIMCEQMKNEIADIEETFNKYIAKFQEADDFAFHVIYDEHKEQEFVQLLDQLEKNLAESTFYNTDKIVLKSIRGEDLINDYRKSLQIDNEEQ